MQIASEKGHADVVKILLEHNVDPNISENVTCSCSLLKNYSNTKSRGSRDDKTLKSRIDGKAIKSTEAKMHYE